MMQVKQKLYQIIPNTKLYQNNKEHIVNVQEVLITKMLGMVFELMGPRQSLLSCSIFNLVASFRSFSYSTRARKCFLLFIA